MQEKMRRALPHVAGVFDHPKVQANAYLVDAIDACADDTVFRRLTHTQISIYLGIHLGFIKQLLEENDALRASLMALDSHSVQ